MSILYPSVFSLGGFLVFSSMFGSAFLWDGFVWWVQCKDQKHISGPSTIPKTDPCVSPGSAATSVHQVTNMRLHGALSQCSHLTVPCVTLGLRKWHCKAETTEAALLSDLEVKERNQQSSSSRGTFPKANHKLNTQWVGNSHLLSALHFANLSLIITTQCPLCSYHKVHGKKISRSNEKDCIWGVLSRFPQKPSLDGTAPVSVYDYFLLAFHVASAQYPN